MPIIVAPIAGVLADRIGGRPILATGMALQAVALGWLALVVTPTVPYENMVVPFILAGIGMGLFFAPIANVVLSAVRPEQEGKASGATNTIREVGGVFGVAVLAAVFRPTAATTTRPPTWRGSSRPSRSARSWSASEPSRHCSSRRVPGRATWPAVRTTSSSPSGPPNPPGVRRGRSLGDRPSHRAARHRPGHRRPGLFAYASAVPSIVSHVPAADGTDLLVRHWPADEAEAGGAWAGPPWASVLLVHGLGEHSGRYEHVGDQLTGAGLEVAAYDHRGMGGSGGRRGDVERWSQYHDDLAARLADVRAGAAGRPVVLYAHSLGGLIAAGYLLDRPPEARPRGPHVAGARFGAAGLEEAAGARAGARRADRSRSRTASTATTLSRDPSVAARTVDDPLCVKVSTARFGALALAEQARVRAAAPGGFGIPTLVLHGEDDRLVPAIGVGGPRGRAAGRAADLPGSSSRAPQRARGAGHRGRDRRLAATRTAGAPGGRAGRDRDRLGQAPIGCVAGRAVTGRVVDAGSGRSAMPSSRTAPNPNRLAIAPTNGTRPDRPAEHDQPEDRGQVRSVGRGPVAAVEQPFADPDGGDEVAGECRGGPDHQQDRQAEWQRR